MLMRTLLVRGMLAGLAAAALALIFAWILGEPQIGHAISFEDQQARLAGAAPAPELVSRTVQETFGLAVAVGLVGLALGGLFSIAFAICYGRIGRFGPRATSPLVALGALAPVRLVPSLKHPATPPSVGTPATTGHRTVLYFTMIAISIAIAIAVIQLGRRLAPRFGNWNACLLAAAAFIALVTVAYLALPAVNEVPRDFPAVVLWRFRLASPRTQALPLGAPGLLFAAPTPRSLAPPPRAPAQATH